MTDKTAAKLPKMYWATPRRAARRDGARKEIAAKLDAEEWVRSGRRPSRRRFGGGSSSIATQWVFDSAGLRQIRALDNNRASRRAAEAAPMRRSEVAGASDQIRPHGLTKASPLRECPRHPRYKLTFIYLIYDMSP